MARGVGAGARSEGRAVRRASGTGSASGDPQHAVNTGPSMCRRPSEPPPAQPLTVGPVQTSAMLISNSTKQQHGKKEP
jgi:hypothetical protein